MDLKQELFARAIVRRLNSTPICDITAARLSAARSKAILSRRRPPATYIEAVTSSFAAYVARPREGAKSMILASALVLAALFTHWSAVESQMAEAALIDLAVLNDSLPIDALADKGFSAFLRHHDEEM